MMSTLFILAWPIGKYFELVNPTSQQMEAMSGCFQTEVQRPRLLSDDC